MTQEIIYPVGWDIAHNVPESIAMWQARAILIEDGILDDVYAFLNAIVDEKERKKAVAKFEYSNTVRRDDPLLGIVLGALGKTREEADELFIRANALK